MSALRVRRTTREPSRRGFVACASLRRSTPGFPVIVGLEPGHSKQIVVALSNDHVPAVPISQMEYVDLSRICAIAILDLACRSSLPAVDHVRNSICADSLEHFPDDFSVGATHVWGKRRAEIGAGWQMRPDASQHRRWVARDAAVPRLEHRELLQRRWPPPGMPTASAGARAKS
jgi:hypothetical protein